MHGPAQQLVYWYFFPVHGKLTELCVWVWYPKPQDTEHDDQSDHGDQQPQTKKQISNPFKLDGLATFLEAFD